MLLIKKEFSGYGVEPLDSDGQRLLDKMIEIADQNEFESQDALWAAAVFALEQGGSVEKYEGFYICLECGCMYHGDYSSNSDPDRDFCGIECELAWLESNPDDEYNGELRDGRE